MAQTAEEMLSSIMSSIGQVQETVSNLDTRITKMEGSQKAQSAEVIDPLSQVGKIGRKTLFRIKKPKFSSPATKGSGKVNAFKTPKRGAIYNQYSISSFDYRPNQSVDFETKEAAREYIDSQVNSGQIDRQFASRLRISGYSALVELEEGSGQGVLGIMDQEDQIGANELLDSTSVE